jgi:hypothetical protein
MSELEKTWKLDKIELRELPQVLIQCGRAVVREITRCVLERKKPIGAPQKANAMSTVVKKGHDHPVAEKRFRFAKESTFHVEPRGEMSVVISCVSPEDGEIGARLEDRGYEFFGITEKASEDAYKIMDTFLTKAVVKAFEGKNS